MDAEREVRTRAGWIGVEISKSRVRTPGKAGYGLYRVRGTWTDQTDLITPGAITSRPVRTYSPTEWTAYAFTLADIDAAVRNAIGQGQPSGPLDLRLPIAAALLPGSFDPETMASRPTGVVVPTRWTHRYQGRRDLGVPGGSPMGDRLAGSVGGASSTRSRQREYNAAFQAEHAARRGHGLKARHAGRGRDA